MTTKNFNFEDLLKAKEAYNSGQNVTEFLRQRVNLTQNSPEIIGLSLSPTHPNCPEYWGGTSPALPPYSILVLEN
jgi:hypothetical protein